MGILMSPSPLPTVTVLLATYNGDRFLDEQLESILGQQGVEVRVVALDDESTDATAQLLARWQSDDDRVTVLPSRGKSGGAARNFYRLIESIDPDGTDLFAFSDQDDVWLPGKLARQAALIADGADGVSSNVTAFTESGERTLVKKDFPQRELDFLLEGPGPGCTFLMSPRLIELAKGELLNNASEARHAEFHDWLLYVLCRARGWRWVIDAEPTVDYRQHSSNVMGANQGAASARKRLGLIANQWHRTEAALLTRVALEVADGDIRPRLLEALELFEHRSPAARARLARLAPELRRRPRDQAIIRALVALGIW